MLLPAVATVLGGCRKERQEAMTLSITPSGPIVYEAEGGTTKVTVTTNQKTWEVQAARNQIRHKGEHDLQGRTHPRTDGNRRPEQAEVGFDECFGYGGHRIGVVRNGFHGQADAVVGDALVYPELFGYLAPHGEGLVLSIFPDVRDGGHPLYYP